MELVSKLIKIYFFFDIILGKALALELSTKTDENFVIIHGRCKQKCQQTMEFLIEENKLKSHVTPNFDYVAADFCHFSDVDIY